MIDNASHRVGGFVAGDLRRKKDPGARASISVDLTAFCAVAQASQKLMLLLVGQEAEESRHREQQRIRISVVEAGPGQKVRTDHFQAVAA